MPSMVDSPSGGAPTKAPRWDLANTEGYGGGNCFSLAPWMFSGYVGIYWRKKYVGVGAKNFYLLITHGLQLDTRTKYDSI